MRGPTASRRVGPSFSRNRTDPPGTRRTVEVEHLPCCHTLDTTRT